MKTKAMFLIINLIVLNIFGQLAPAKITAPLITKVIPFEKNISSQANLVIHVISDSDVQKAMEDAVGQKVGSSEVTATTSGSSIMPGAKVVIVDDPSQVENVKKYCRANKALSITRDENIQKKGITLCITVSGGKPKLIINEEASNAEGLSWNPALFKIAEKLN